MRPTYNRRWTTPLALLFGLGGLGAGLTHCATLPDITADACGNGVKEELEDCDPLLPQTSDAQTDGASVSSGSVCRRRGELHECRFDCTGTNRCPTGWGCDVSARFCRKPSGEYVEVTQRTPAGAVHASLLDMDGDGRLDVLTRSGVGQDQSTRVRVHYLRDDGVVSQVGSLPLSVTGPTAFDLPRPSTDTATTGRLLVGSLGVGVFEGTVERTLQTQLLTTGTSPSGTWSYGVGFVPPSALAVDQRIDPSPAFFVTRDQASAAVSLVGGGPKIQLPSFLVDGDKFFEVRTVAGSPARPLQFVRNGAPTACSYAMLVPPPGGPEAMRREGVVLLPVPPCVEPPTTVGTPGGGTFANVFVVPTVGDRSAIVFARQSGTDLRLSIWSDLRDARAANWRDIPNVRTDVLLAVADLNNDARIDLITTTGVFIAAASAGDAGPDAGDLPQLAYVKQSAPWTTAVVGDFNGDGLLDVAAGSGASGTQPRERRTTADLDILLGSGQNRVSSVIHQTAAGVTHLAAGDFDGDRIDDLAYAEQTETEGVFSVNVLFGSRTNEFRTVATVGRFRGLVQLIYGGVGSAGTGTYEPGKSIAPKLIIVGDKTVSVAFGNAERSLFAPLYLPASGGGTRPDPIASVPLQNDGRGGLVTAAAVLEPTPTAAGGVSLYTAELDAAGVLRVPAFRRTIGSWQPRLPFALSKYRTGGREVPLVLASTGVNKTSLYSIQEDGQLTDRVLAADAGALEPGPRLGAFDLDGDGDEEPLWIARKEAGQGQRQLRALLKNGQVATIAATDFAVLRDASGARVLVVIDAKEADVVIFQVALKDGALTRGSTLASFAPLKPRVGAPGAEQDSVTGLAAGDVTGDGIDDLVVIDSNTIRVFKGGSVLP